MAGGFIGLWLLVLPFAAPVGPTANEQMLVSRFVGALRQGTPAAFAPLSAANSPADGPAWASVRDTLERFHAIEVSSYEATVARDRDHATLRLRLNAAGVLANARGERRSLPHLWYLQVVKTPAGLVLTGAEAEERSVGRELLAAASEPEQREILRSHPALDRRSAYSELEAEAYACVSSVECSSDSDAGQRAWVGVSSVLGLAAEQGDPVAESLALRTLALMSSSLPAANAALDLATDSGSCDAIALALLARGDIRGGEGGAAAELDFERAAAMVDVVEDPRVAMKALNNLADWHRRHGELREAVLVARRLVAAAGRFGWREGEALGHWNEADVESDLRQPALAIAQLQQTYQGLRAAANLGWAAIALGDLATATLRAGRTTAALRLHREAIALARGRVSARWWNRILSAPVATLLAQGRRAEAAQLVNEAHRDLAEDPAVMLAAAQVRLAEGKLREALQLASDAATASEAELHWQAEAVRGDALRRLGRVIEAETALRNAIEVIESSRANLPVGELDRATVFADKLQPYRELLALLADGGRAREALVIAEGMKAQALQETLEAGRVDLSPAMTEEEKQGERELNARIVELNRRLLADGEYPQPDLRAELATARHRLESFLSDLYLQHPAVAARRVPAAHLLEQGVELLPAGSAVVEFAMMPDRTLAFTISHGRNGLDVRVGTIALPAATLERRVESFVQALQHRDLGFGKAARSLYRLLFTPTGAELLSVSTLAIIPDGALWRVPFPVLENRSGQPLVTQFAMFRAPSIWALEHSSTMGDVASTNLRLLAFGNPQVAGVTALRAQALQRGPGLGPLPDAEREVREIGALYGAAYSEVRVGADAREHVLKQEAARYDVIHLATHALLDDTAPMYSALVLGAGPAADGEDGLLEAREIAELRLHARLVVLSACETGRGVIRDGEGVVGLSWAFLAAGVPTLVVSDWDVPSAATARLMVDFHRRLLSGTPPAEALRQAEMQLMRDARYRHPFYWAAFTVVGAGW
jgi:CHAT domain-containing protein/tetratricopeptide (TPR) repeat protein